MKKILMALATTVMALPAFAQYSSGDFNFDKSSLYYGARIGLNMSGIGGDVSYGTKTGMTLAGVVGMRVSNALFLESGLYYTQRGGKDGDLSMTLKNLEIPIVIKYGIQATDKIAVLPFLGPYFSWGIGGKYKNDKLDQEESSYNFVNHGDMGIKVGCGAEYDMLYLEAGYQFGLTNIAKNDDFTIHSNALFLNFGVNF